MIIDNFKRDEDNEVIAICGEVEIPLTAEYISIHKPKIGDELIFEEPTETK
jgi:hypothetical protein